MSKISYVIVSPARDEENSIERTIWLLIWFPQPPKREYASYKIGLCWPALRWLLRGELS